MKGLNRFRAGVIVVLAALAFMAAGAAQAAANFSGTVNINTASVDQLTEIPGIGPAKANAIVAYRAEKPFTSVEEIKDVKGIGDKLFAKIEPHLTVSGETRLGTDDQRPGSGAKAKK